MTDIQAPIFQHAESVLMQGIVQWPPAAPGEKAGVLVQESTVLASPIKGLTLAENQIVGLELIGPANGSAKTLRISCVISDTPVADDETPTTSTP